MCSVYKIHYSWFGQTLGNATTRTQVPLDIVSAVSYSSLLLGTQWLPEPDWMEHKISSIPFFIGWCCLAPTTLWERHMFMVLMFMFNTVNNSVHSTPTFPWHCLPDRPENDISILRRVIHDMNRDKSSIREKELITFPWVSK